MSKVPNPLIPGVSISHERWGVRDESGRHSISENVVVWVPVLWASLISAVRRFASGMSRLMSVDFPTPLLPESSVIFPCNRGRSSSTPSPDTAEMALHS